MSLRAAVVATAGFVLTILVLERVHIVLYPDVFPGRTYVDEDGRRYVYEKRQSIGGFSPVRGGGGGGGDEAASRARA